MSANSPTCCFDIYSTITGIATVAVAVVALLYAVHSENRTQNRYRQDAQRQERLAAASVRPLLTTRINRRPEKREIVLMNVGLGPAMRIRPYFRKGNYESTRDVVSVLYTSHPFRYDYVLLFLDVEGMHVIQGDNLTILLVTRDNLTRQDFDSATIDQIFAAWDEAVSGLEIRFEYEDILGNNQSPYHWTVLSDIHT